MGNVYSSTKTTQQQTAMQYLGERYPFGDEEILRLVRCHSYLRRARQVRKSFLSDWAVFCATLPPDVDACDFSGRSSSSASSMSSSGCSSSGGWYGSGTLNKKKNGVYHNNNATRQQQQQQQQHINQKTRQQQEEEEFRAMAHLRRERAKMMSVVEGRILPSGFGRRLERAAFLLQRDVIDYRSSSMCDSPITPMPGRLRRSNDDSDYYDYDFECPRPRCFRSPCICFGGGEDGEQDDRLERRKLLSNPVVATNNNNNHTQQQQQQQQEQQADRSFERLEKFLEGAAECSRRGARASLTVLFKCCSRNSRGGYTSDEHYGSGANMSHVNLNAGFGCEGEKTIKASASEVLDLGYSLAVASAFLAAASSEQPVSGGGGGVRGKDCRGGTSSNTSNKRREGETNSHGNNHNHNNNNNNNYEGVEVELNHEQQQQQQQQPKLTHTAAATKEFLPHNNELQKDNTALDALAKSLYEYGQKRRKNDQYPSPVIQSKTPTTIAYRTTNSDVTSSSNKSTSTYSTNDNNNNNNNNNTIIHANNMMVTLDVFLEWAESTAPLLSACLATFMHHILFPDRVYPSSRTPFDFPNLRGETSAFFNCSSSTYLYSLACMSPSLGGTWHRLYTSDCDGLSFNRLQLSLQGYGGPTLIIIRSTSGGVFGAFTASSWKESKDFYGSSDCFLYQLSPSTGMYRPRGTERNFMYCNSFARSRGYDKQAHGIGFGGTVDQPRLFIDETFDNCVGMSRDSTFEAGALLPPAPEGGSQKYFDIDALEVWGVGGDDVVSEALESRHKQREIIAANIQKARKVDKRHFLDDFNSGLIDSKAFAHRQQVRGRVDCHVGEDG